MEDTTSVGQTNYQVQGSNTKTEFKRSHGNAYVRD